jgi:hypothetical protein
MDSSWLGNSERLQLLRVIVGFSHLTAKQAPRFLRCFEKNSVELVLACVACFGSIVDSHNFIPVVLSTLPPHVVSSDHPPRPHADSQITFAAARDTGGV